MKEILEKYEAVIGLEIHVQLATASKAYSTDATDYGAMPNTQVSPISLGHPGTLPKVNEKVIEYAVKLGLACGCTIRERNEYARKNYFYADLPKGYQITQDKTPICTGGFVEIKDAQGNPKKIGLTRIHMEEDSGKSVHDIDPFNTLVDLNRAGTPLLEIVSEPDFVDGQEAYNYLTEMRRLVRYLDISDGNMEEGSLRCDVNISIKPIGRKEFGTKVEVKNLNSFRNVQKAIDYEIQRQYEVLESGGEVIQQTMNFDAGSGKTILLRAKEDAHDYRYFPEPDLQPVFVKQPYVEEVKNAMPPLPRELYAKYRELNLNDYDASLLTETKEIALYFDEMIAHTQNYKAAANWMMGTIKSHLNERAMGIKEFSLAPKTIAALIELVDSNKVSNSVASNELFKMLLENPEADPGLLAKENNLIQESDAGALQTLIDEALANYPAKVEEYKAGKKGLMGLFVGEVMKLSKGKADPKMTTKLLQEKLDN
jgi:aspartyl-tRNA(Asn)/glutamyl-tRNA(Gln) amidotransferase subunit B